MSKLRKSIFIFGLIILCASVALVTFLTLSATGMIASDPVEITVSVNSVTVTYDAKPHKASDYTIVKGELLKGHSIQPLEYIGSQTDVGSCESDMTLRIIDENKRDVSGEYGITVVSGAITVVKRNITVNQSDITVDYNGKPVINDSFSVEEDGGLCEGHRLVPSSFDEGTLKPTGAVPSITEFAPSVFDASGNNVTGNYNIAFNSGDTTVNKRSIAVTPVSVERTYDGTPLAPGEYYISSGTLAEGHKISEVSFAAEGSTKAVITDVESITVRVDGVRITDAQNNDVSDCYAVTKNTGTLTIVPKLLTVVGKSGKKNESGQIVDADGNVLEGALEYSELAPGEELEVAYTGTISEPGSVPNTFIVTILRNGQEVSSGNYVISKTYGTLTMERKTLEFACADVQTEYSGNAIKLAFGGTKGEYDEKTNILSLGALPSGLTASDVEIVAPEIKNAGEYEYTVRLTDTANAAKYYLNVTSGKVTVNKAKLEIQAINPITKVYDGQPARIDAKTNIALADYETVYISEALLGQECIKATDYYDVPINGIELRDIITHENVTGNYDVTYVNGLKINVYINKREINVSLQNIVSNFEDIGDIEWSDEQFLSNITVQGSLADGNVFAVASGGRLDIDGDWSESWWSVKGYTIVDVNGVDVSENYTFNETARGGYTYVPAV